MGLNEQLMKLTAYWRFVLGLSIVLLVVLFPRGLVGTWLYWRALLGGIILFLVLAFPAGIVGTTAAVFSRFSARSKP
jgi:ABC-type branched-subunit amino acid transport system permease subunit